MDNEKKKYQDAIDEINEDIYKYVQKLGYKDAVKTEYYQHLLSEKQRMQGELRRIHDRNVKNGTEKRTTMDARLDAWGRYHGMKKFKQTITKATGQYNKLQRLSKKVTKSNDIYDKELMGQLDNMFRR